MPMPTRSSDWKRSSASCCERMSHGSEPSSLQSRCRARSARLAASLRRRRQIRWAGRAESVRRRRIRGNNSSSRRDLRRRAKNQCSRAGSSPDRAAADRASEPRLRRSRRCARGHTPCEARKSATTSGVISFAPAGPHRQHAGLAGHLAPLLGDIVDEERIDAGNGLLAVESPPQHPSWRRALWPRAHPP